MKLDKIYERQLVLENKILDLEETLKVVIHRIEAQQNKINELWVSR
jgi:hypothetical protein